MDPLVVSANMASRMLNISAKQMQDLLMSGTVPAYRDGKGWKVPVKALNQYIDDRCAEARKEMGAC